MLYEQTVDFKVVLKLFLNLIYVISIQVHKLTYTDIHIANKKLLGT